MGVDAAGVGHAVYRASGQGQTYSLVAFAHDLPDHLRSDRVIAEAWDTTFALMDGEPEAAISSGWPPTCPKQEAGRVSDRELSCPAPIARAPVGARGRPPRRGASSPTRRASTRSAT
jgi:hypothetical protein